MEYHIGILFNKNDKRIENNSRVKLILDYFKQSNSLNSIKLTYFDISDDNYLPFILNTNNIKVWITAAQDITSLINIFFGENIDCILISVCDDKFIQKDYTNIIHVNNSDVGQMLQLLNTAFTYINTEVGGIFTNIYLFFDNDNLSYEKYFRLNQLPYNTKFIPITYCNTDNQIQYGETISQITMYIAEGIITNINTFFIYLTRDFNAFFKIYTIVEIPISIQSDVIITSSIRHICSTNTYINSGYIDIFNLMKEYLIPYNFCTNESQLNTFFNKSLRMTIFAPLLSRYEIEKYNYINYVFYIKNPVSATFLNINRITLFSILMEKALKIAGWLLYRDLPTLTSLTSKGILLDGKLFGPPNQLITQNYIDGFWYNRIPYYTFEPNSLYYITEFVNKVLLNTQNVIENEIQHKNNISRFGGIYTFIEPEAVSITLAQGVSSIGGNNVIINE